MNDQKFPDLRQAVREIERFPQRHSDDIMDPVPRDMAHYVPTPWYQRLLRRVFPVRSLPPLEDFAGNVTTNTIIRLSWRDLLRVLVSRRMVLRTRAYAQHPIARVARTDCAFYIPPPGSRE